MADGPSSGAPRRDQGAEKGTRLQVSVLEECLREKGIDEAWNLLEHMQQSNTETDKFSVSRMLMRTVSDARGPRNSDRVYRGIALVERFIERQPGDVDEVLFNALLDTCCRLRDVERLETCVKKMRELNIKPSAVTLGILVKTYGHAGDLSKVLAAWEEMSTQRHQANAVTYGCMLDACVKCGDLGKALEVFQEMKREGRHRNTILYTTLIKGHGMEKNFHGAIALFHEMKD
jgi:pentatricopeptide repeat domain-containing protein 1